MQPMGGFMQKWLRICKIVALACSTAAVPALGADMPVKAAPLNPACPYFGAGFYFGLDSAAAVQTTKSSGLFVGNLVSGNITAAGGVVGGTVGYAWGTCTNFWMIEGSVDYQNITGGTIVANSVTGMTTTANSVSRWQGQQVLEWGGFSSLLAYLPQVGISFPTLPALPVGLSNVGTSHAYLMAGIQEIGYLGNKGAAEFKVSQASIDYALKRSGLA